MSIIGVYIFFKTQNCLICKSNKCEYKSYSKTSFHWKWIIQRLKTVKIIFNKLFKYGNVM